MSSDVFVETILQGRFSRYKERLGSGAYKTVFKGYDHENGIEIAWNQIKFERLKDTERARLDEEIKILSILQHANIINFYDFYIDDEKKRLVILTELMTSGTLRQFVLKSRQPTKLKVIKRWCVQILKGLSYLHSMNIIHRDLKCDNIFINGSMGEVKIGDLGLSTVMTRTHAESVIGTPEFMAPEFYDEHYTEKVDTYAFGMCLLEMATQEYPYSECTNAAQIYKKVTGGRPPAALLRIEDPDVRQFIELCIGAFEDRPSPSELLDHNFFRLEGATDSEPVKMRPREVQDKGVLMDGKGVVDGPAANPNTSPNNSNTSRLSTPRQEHLPNGLPNGPSSLSMRGAEHSVPTASEGDDSTVASGLSSATSIDTRASANTPADSLNSERQEVVVGRFHQSAPLDVEGSENTVNTVPGTREIKLQLVIADVQKEVTFPFNVETDTAHSVATEMAHEFNLTCGVEWLTNELQKRVNMIESTDSKYSGSPPGPHGSSPPSNKSRGRVELAEVAHDSPRMSAVTVPVDKGHLNKQTEQTSEGSWLVPAITMPEAVLKETGAMPPANPDRIMADRGVKIVADRVEEAAHGKRVDPIPAVEEQSERGDKSKTGSLPAMQPDGGPTEPVSNLSTSSNQPGAPAPEKPAPAPAASEAAPDAEPAAKADSGDKDVEVQSGPVDDQEIDLSDEREATMTQEVLELETEIQQVNQQISDLHAKVQQLNTLRSTKFAALTELQKAKRHRAARNAVPDGKPVVPSTGQNDIIQVEKPESLPNGVGKHHEDAESSPAVDINNNHTKVVDSQDNQTKSEGAPPEQGAAAEQQLDVNMLKQLDKFKQKPTQLGQGATKPPPTSSRLEKEDDPLFGDFVQ